MIYLLIYIMVVFIVYNFFSSYHKKEFPLLNYNRADTVVDVLMAVLWPISISIHWILIGNPFKYVYLQYIKNKE